jgi:hypothetical protein
MTKSVAGVTKSLVYRFGHFSDYGYLKVGLINIIQSSTI